jgi:hypothetical protein
MMSNNQGVSAPTTPEHIETARDRLMQRLRENPKFVERKGGGSVVIVGHRPVPEPDGGGDPGR